MLFVPLPYPLPQGEGDFTGLAAKSYFVERNYTLIMIRCLSKKSFWSAGRRLPANQP
jgi:hypothetical protein